MEENVSGKDEVRKKQWHRWAALWLDILMFLLICFGVYVLLAVLCRVLSTSGSSEPAVQSPWMLLCDETCLLCSVVLSAWGVLHRRGMPLSCLGLAFRWKGILCGLFLALLLHSLGWGLVLAAGAVQVEEAVWHVSVLWPMLLLFLLVAITEELLVRGFLLGRMLDGGMNRWWALFLSSLLFAVMHFFNPDFSWLAFLNILLAGLLLGIPFVYTRNLSFPIGFHWFWNWIQGPVLGYRVSGNESGESLFSLSFSESGWLHGGSFGFEGSLLCTILLALAVGGLLLYYVRRMK